MDRIFGTLVAVALAACAAAPAYAIRTGSTGNEPVDAENFPKGAAAIINYPGRIAMWEINGNFSFECRGDAKAFAAVLADFAKLDVKNKKIVVHDGVGHSYWIDPEYEPEKMDEARCDWVFQIWQDASWQRVRKLPPAINPTDLNDSEPPAIIEVFTANIPWKDVKVPAGITVDDRRLEAHGFTTADGIVLEGHVTDLANGKPLPATMRLERIENNKVGNHFETVYTDVGTAQADAQGHWVLKHAPPGWVRVVIEAEGFVPRVAGYERFAQQPAWASHDTGLAGAGSVAGRVTDSSGSPLADVEVEFIDFQPKTGGNYETPRDSKCKTDAQGRFHLDGVPTGTASIWLRKDGYRRTGGRPSVTVPKEDLELTMLRAGSIRVTIDFAGDKRPQQYMVDIKAVAEGEDFDKEEQIGSFGGSATMNKKNEVLFETVPPGRYALRGHPNPYTPGDLSKWVVVDLKGGQAAEVTIKAK